MIANRALNGLEIERHSIAIYNTELRSSLIRSSYASFAVSDLHFATVYGLRTVLGGCKVRGGRMPPDPAISFCTSRGSSHKRSVPMLCPSNGDVLATPLIGPQKAYKRSCEARIWDLQPTARQCTKIHSKTIPQILLNSVVPEQECHIPCYPAF